MSRTCIALATCTAWPELDADGPDVLAALAAEGLDADLVAWDDTTADWAAYPLVVIRTTWDYWDRHAQFLTWTRSVPHLVHSADVVAWNTDKAYLRRLEAAGIPVVPTIWVASGEDFAPPDHPFVVKPSVSAGARDTAAYDGGDSSANAHVARLHAAGKTVMVQPYVDAVDSEGETAVLVFDGVVSHGARKPAVLTLGEGQAALGSWSMQACTPSAEERALALRVVEVASSWGEDLLYARVDLLPGPLVIELEVTEPSLYLTLAPGSAPRFAAAVARRLASSSSGAATPRS